MSDQRPTPETDTLEFALSALNFYDRYYKTLTLARGLERERDEARDVLSGRTVSCSRCDQAAVERDEAREESKMWKANHDNQVKLKSALMDRHDLGDRARKVVALAKERDEARERERVAIASWDEERQRALREGERVVEARELARELRDALEALLPYIEGDRIAPWKPCVSALTKAKEVLEP
jgi:hypothetical protein